MKKLLILLAIACICFPAMSSAQTPPCGFDILHKKQLTEDPGFARTIERNNETINRYINNHPESGRKVTGRQMALFTIPVVVHVVHTGDAIGTIYNPDDAQIIGAINYLNSIYNGTHPDLAGGVGDIEIQFVLAQRDPNCNPTNGIDRVNGTVLANYDSLGVNAAASGGVSELSVKNLSRWNPSNYYNIWVVNKIDGADGTDGQFIAGFAYFPGSSPLVDGTIMLATQMQAERKTLPHEMGHALNVYHPFEGSFDAATCPGNSNCNTQGDRVCDTDPISANQTGLTIDFTCRTGLNTCVSPTPTNYSPNTERNIMSYTTCFELFTAGQKARMIAAMSLPSRVSLAASAAATATYLAPACAPKINFEINADGMTENTVTTHRMQIIQGLYIQYGHRRRCKCCCHSYTGEDQWRCY
jgi:hypothetical protein